MDQWILETIIRIAAKPTFSMGQSATNGIKFGFVTGLVLIMGHGILYEKQ